MVEVKGAIDRATWLDKFRELSACGESIEWLETLPNSVDPIGWAECDRGDWMMWLVAKLLDRRTTVTLACRCARLALRHVPVGEPRPLAAIEAAEGWVRGEVSIKDVRIASDAAYAAYATFDATYTAATAAYAASSAATAAYAAAATAAYVADWTSVLAAAANRTSVLAAAADRTSVLTECADIVREFITYDQLEAAMLETPDA